MVSDRSRGWALALATVVALTGTFVSGVGAQATQNQTEQEPNDSPLNATLVQPGASVSGAIADEENASNASPDYDWYSIPVQRNTTTAVSFENGPNSDSAIVFLISPDTLQEAAAASANGTNASAGNASELGALPEDATPVGTGDTTTLTVSPNRSGVYYLGVVGLNGTYNFSVETGEAAMDANATNATSTAMTTEPNASMAGTGTESQTPTTTATPTPTPSETTTATQSPTPTESTAGDNSGGGGDTETSASGPGFGVGATIAAVLAGALLARRS